MSDPLDDAPETLHQKDDETLQKAQAWVEGGHPEACLDRLIALMDEERAWRYEALQGVMTAHLLAEHPDDLDQLACLERLPHFIHSDRLGIDAAVAGSSPDLRDRLLDRWGELRSLPSGPRLVNVITARLDEADFRLLWAEAWDEPDPDDADMLTKLLWASDAHEGFTEERLAFVEENLSGLCDVLGLGPTLLYVAGGRIDEARRDALLHGLLDEHGLNAARLLGTKSHRPMEPGSSMVRAYEMLREDSPYAAETQLALAAALRADAEAVAEDIGRLANEDGAIEIDGERFRMINDLRWAIQAEMDQALFDVIAQQALEEDAEHHDHLAWRLFFLRPEPELIRNWVERSLKDEGAAAYNTGLLRRALSKKDEDETWKEPLVELAEQLFEVHGQISVDDVHRQWAVEDASRVHKAVALMREMGPPEPEPDVDAIIETMQAYPATLDALGGKAFETWLRNNPSDFVKAWRYHRRPEDSYADLQEAAEQGQDVRALMYGHRRIEDDIAFRQRAEVRFELPAQKNIQWKQKELRLSQDAWLEAMVGARLLEAGFEIRREPSDVLPDGPDLDFLVTDPETGVEFWLEIRRLGQRPDEVFDRVHVSLGGEPKKSLQNKLKKQLGGGEVDPERPLVIGLQVPTAMELEYSVPNSLGGVFQINARMGEDRAVSEGVGRDQEEKKGLLHEPEARYLSGVLAFRAERPTDEQLVGEMFWPPELPPHPLPLGTYVRLRDALLGEMPRRSIESMMWIPTITREEAEALVSAGMESPSLLASGRVDLDELPLDQDRLEELVEETRWRATLAHYGTIGLLKSARGVDLEPFYDAGIYTLVQLLRSEAPPEGVPEGVWHGMRFEADRFSPMKPG